MLGVFGGPTASHADWFYIQLSVCICVCLSNLGAHPTCILRTRVHVCMCVDLRHALL